MLDADGSGLCPVCEEFELAEPATGAELRWLGFWIVVGLAIWAGIGVLAWWLTHT